MAEDGVVVRLRLRWRFFWSRRSRTRISSAFAFALLALLAIICLALPVSGQSQVIAGLRSVAQGVASLGLGTALAVSVAIFFLLSLILIFVPSYRRHSYLATAPSIIPPVSVYLDAENQLSEAAIGPFIEFLIKHLDGRRADLLYFLDASQTASGKKYKTLFRFGFRPVDVPHDPTGKGEVKEAVDRELDMHAYERALLGPPEQEFIIVTGDADFVPLIYRLAALGHRTQIWATPVREAYRVVEKYLGVPVIDLSQVTSELQAAPPDITSVPSTSPNKKAKSTSQHKSPSRQSKWSLPKRIPAPASLSQPGEEHLYYAVAETLAAHAEALSKSRADHVRNGHFHALLRGTYGPRMAGVGYSIGNWLDYWIEHLIALGVLIKIDGQAFPKRGSTNEEDAARSLFAMSNAAANTAVQVGAGHVDSLVRMSEVSAALAADPALFDETSSPLFKILTAESGRRITSVRYFVRSARALRLLEFEDVPDSLDLIAHPRLAIAPPSSQDTESTNNLPDSSSDQPTSGQDEVHTNLPSTDTNQTVSSETETLIVPLMDTHEQTETELT